MRVLITGVTGFVGSWMAEHALSEGAELHGLKRWRSPLQNIEGILDRIRLHDGDLKDLSSLITVLSEVEPDLVFHLAAQSYVPYSYRAPAQTIATNTGGTVNLLEAVRILKQDPIIHVVSSSEVYGQVTEADVPITEECPLRPVNLYGVSKVGADMAAYAYWKAHGLKTIRSRMFTHTGPRQHEGLFTSAFARQIARIELGFQEPVIWVGNLGSVRTLADVRDTVRAYWLLVTKCPPGEVYNIGGSTTMKVGDVLDELIKLSKYEGSFRIEPDPALLRPADVTLQIPCVEKFKAATGWEPDIPCERTLKDLLEYWREFERRNGADPGGRQGQPAEAGAARRP